MIERIVEWATNLSTREIIAQSVGMLGIVANFIIYQQKERKRMLRWKRFADLVWVFVYLALVWAGNPTAIAGSATCVVGIFRETVFLHHDKKWAQSKWWLVLFIALMIGSSFVSLKLTHAVISPKTLYYFLPGLASTMAVVSFWIGKPRVTRLLVFPISGAMITYDIIIFSVAGFANELFTFVSAIVGIIRHDMKKSAG